MVYLLLILIGVVSRLLPHAPNFTAVGAVALYSGYYIKNKKLAVLIPIALMLLTDGIIGFYQWQVMASVYGSFLLVFAFGNIISKKKWTSSIPISIVGSLAFFLITNFAVWQFNVFYPHTLNGLISCYISGLPFFRNSFLGDTIYTTTFFSATELAYFLVKCQNSKYRRFLFLGK